MKANCQYREQLQIKQILGANVASGFTLEIALSKHSNSTLPNANALTMHGKIPDGDEPFDDTCDDEIGDKGDVKIIEWTLTRESRDRQC